MCSVRRAGSGFTSRGVGVGLSDSDSDCSVSVLLGLPCLCFFFSFVRCPSRLLPAKTNNCSVQLVAGCESELLFAPDPAFQLGVGFGLHNCSVFYPVLSPPLLCEVCMPGSVNELLFAFTQLDARPNKKTHANAWAIMQSLFLLKHKR